MALSCGSGGIGRRTGFRFQRLIAVRVRVSPPAPLSLDVSVQKDETINPTQANGPGELGRLSLTLAKLLGRAT